MPKLKFLRRNWSKASRLGKGRKKKQIWRSPKGRHSKTRGERKGYPAIVKIGYRQNQEESGLIKNKVPVIIKNLNDLSKMEKNEIAIVGNVGNKKRLEILKAAKEKGIQISNINATRLLKKADKKKKFKEAEKEKLKTAKEKKQDAKEEKKEEKKSEEKK